MADRPMHTIPGAFERLTTLYAEGEQAVDEGRFEDAVAKFSEGIAIDDHFRQRYITMYAQRGFALQRLERFEEAIADYTKALELGEPEVNQAQYFFHRGMCLEKLGDAEGAVADYGSSIERYREHPGPYHFRGRLLVNALDRYEEGIADLDKLLEMRDVPDGYRLRGFARHALGDLEAAKADFARARELEPDAYSDYMLACIYAATGERDEMLAALARAVTAEPTYKQQVVDDDEFGPYRTDPQFIALVT